MSFTHLQRSLHHTHVDGGVHRVQHIVAVRELSLFVEQLAALQSESTCHFPNPTRLCKRLHGQLGTMDSFWLDVFHETDNGIA